MLRTLLLLLFLARLMTLSAQAPESFDLQGIARSTTGEVLASQAIALRIGIVADEVNGTVIYQETHAVTTNAYGLFTVAVGGGAPVLGTFADVPWGTAPHFVQVELDPTGGTAYQVVGTQQLLSVPYALHAANGLPGGGTSGQVLTNCCGVPTWATGGICPGTLSGLQCALADHTGALYAGVLAGGVRSSVPYEGCLAGPHPGQVVASTGVTGLTATLAAGNFDPVGGALNYVITGTPSGVGTARFALNIGGRSCTLTREVLPLPGAFNPALAYGSDVDQDGNTFLTITIGDQEWMAENLRVSTFANGAAIPNTTAGTSQAAWVHYNNDAQYEVPYGKLYNWYAVSDPRAVCPTGWHVPSDAEWNTLVATLDPAYLPGASGEQSPTAGGPLKATTNWAAPNTGATNATGFTALPGGISIGIYLSLGSSGWWWTATQSSALNAWYRRLVSDSSAVERDQVSKDWRVSVRCVRD
ncbi:MAG: fibrobacter succinogenes major paralogous domain-containing protein [Flavobacteriales bacterium]